MASADYLEIASRTAAAMSPKKPDDTDYVAGDKMWTYINVAYRWLFDEMGARGAAATLCQITQSLVTTQTSIVYDNLVTTQAMNPRFLWEKAVDSGDPWQLMTYTHPLPQNIEAGPYARYWDMGVVNENNVAILFPPRTQNLSIKYEFIGRIYGGSLTSPRDNFEVPGTADIVGIYAAHLVAQNVARDFQLGDRLRKDAYDRLGLLMVKDAKVRQQDPTRMYAVRNGLRDRWW